jgi:hypothetical protein
MQLLFWDCNGLVLELYVQQGTTVTAASYIEILKSRLKPEICNKVQRFAVQGAFLPCNNACLHSAAATVEGIRQLKFEFLPCPTYSLDLAPLDDHMFGPIKEALCGQRLASDEVEDVVHMWLRSQSKTFFTDGIRSLVNC